MKPQDFNPPPLDGATVEHALKLAPDRCPDPNDTEREIWMKAGERRLAVKLRTIHQKQEKDFVPNP